MAANDDFEFVAAVPLPTPGSERVVVELKSVRFNTPARAAFAPQDALDLAIAIFTALDALMGRKPPQRTCPTDVLLSKGCQCGGT